MNSIINYHYGQSTIRAAQRLPERTMSEQAHRLGMERGEPLIVAMDALTKYASAYKQRFENGLSEDYVLGPLWLDSIKGLRGLLNGDGAIAMQQNISTDRKDNGAVESMFWEAMKIAGFTEADL